MQTHSTIALMLPWGAALLVACGGSATQEHPGTGGSAQAGSAGASTGGAGGAGGAGGTAGSATGGSSGAGNSTSTDPFWQDQEVGDPPLCPTEGRPDSSMRPAQSEAPDLSPIYLAWSRLRFGGVASLTDLSYDPLGWTSVGFNLDLSCNSASWPDGTLSGEAASVCPAARERACQNAIQNVFDGEFCRDNSFGSRFADFAASPMGEAFRLNEQDFNCALHQGSMSIIFKLSGYSGELNDSSVRLDVYSGVGASGPQSWECRGGEGRDQPLLFDWANQPAGASSFDVAARDLDPTAPGGQIRNSKWADPAAFVRNGWLIASLPPDSELWFNGLNAHTRGLRLVTQNSLIAARLEQASGRWSIPRGTIGGSLRASDIVTALRETGLCENMCDSYNATVGAVNASPDMLAESNDPAPSVACDALSYGIEFRGQETAVGNVVNVPPPTECPEPPRHEEIGRHGCTCPPAGVGAPCL